MTTAIVVSGDVVGEHDSYGAVEWQFRGVATVYAKTHLRKHLTQNYGVHLSQF